MGVIQFKATFPSGKIMYLACNVFSANFFFFSFHPDWRKILFINDFIFVAAYGFFFFFLKGIPPHWQCSDLLTQFESGISIQSIMLLRKRKCKQQQQHQSETVKSCSRKLLGNCHIRKKEKKSWRLFMTFCQIKQWYFILIVLLLFRHWH